MPLYEYQCDACGVRFERRHSMTADPLKTCPECGGEVHRLILPVGIVFKGKGFYVTDNRGKSSTATSKSKDEGKSETSGKGEKKKESKPKSED